MTFCRHHDELIGCMPLFFLPGPQSPAFNFSHLSGTIEGREGQHIAEGVGPHAYQMPQLFTSDFIAIEHTSHLSVGEQAFVVRCNRRRA